MKAAKLRKLQQRGIYKLKRVLQMPKAKNKFKGGINAMGAHRQTEQNRTTPRPNIDLKVGR